MFTFLVLLEVIIAVVLIIIILLQSSKGGGLAAGLGGSNIGTVFGVRRTADFLSRATTYLAGTFIILALIINLFFLPGKGKTSESVIQSGQQTTVPAPQIPNQQPTQNQ
jgi:preprotein translocase subunit SecG